MRDSQTSPNPIADARENAALLRWIVEIGAGVLPALLHRPGTFGRRFFAGHFGLIFAAFLPVGWGGAGPLGVMLLLFVIGGLAAQGSLLPLALFLLVFWLPVTMLQRACGVIARYRRVRRGEAESYGTLYPGAPWLASWLPLSESLIAGVLEPFLAAGLGLALGLLWNAPLGTFLLYCAIAQAVSEALRRRDLQAYEDAMQDQRVFAQAMHPAGSGAASSAPAPPVAAAQALPANPADASLAAAYARLDPALQAMLHPGPSGGPKEEPRS